MRVLSVLVFLLACPLTLAGEWGHKGQISAWWTIGEGSLSEDSLLGQRYIPEFSYELEMGEGRSLDGEVSFNLFNAGPPDDPDRFNDGELYRGWVRYKTNQLEIRAGRQKINFGPALLLRSLRWFDRIDPRDPLGETEAVDALLFRYYHPNNTNVWLWATRGDDALRGLEQTPGIKDEAETGARIQLPLQRGEIAATWFSRDTDERLFGGLEGVRETRFALDGRWDLAWGLWFETVSIQRASQSLLSDTQTFITLGADQTINWKNGLHLLAEHLIIGSGDEVLDLDEDVQVSSVSLDYSLGLYTSIRALANYNWEQREFFPYLSVGMVYDRWSFYVQAFDNPSSSASGQSPLDRTNAIEGTGVQLLAVFHY